MKNTLPKSLLAAILFALLALLGLVGLGQPAMAETKIGIVDMRKVFDGYYKTKQADAALKEERAEIDKERAEMVDSYHKHEDEWKKLIEKANDQSLSAEERDRSKQSSERKVLELKDLEKNVEEFDRAATTKQQEKKRSRWEAIVGEIRAAIDARAKADGYSLVLDTAGESLNNTPTVLYTNGGNDLTEPVLSQLNAAAPVTTKNDAKPDAKSDAKPETKPGDKPADPKK